MTAFTEIPCHKGYKINSDGSCIIGPRGHPLRFQPSHGGYWRVNIRDNVEFIHRLVAFAFIGPQPSKNHTIDHIDGDKLNNRYTNLRWITGRMNSWLGVRRNMPKVMDDKTVLRIRKLHRSGVSYEKIAKMYSRAKCTIRLMCVGQSYKHLPIEANNVA